MAFFSYGYPIFGNQSSDQQPSPFIPPANLEAGGSPYISPYRGTTALPGSSPNANASNPLPGTPNTPLNFVPYENYYHYGPGGWEYSTNSLSSFYNFVPPWIINLHPQRNYLPIPSGLRLHPLLSGDSGHTSLIFNLSSPKFDPMKCLGSRGIERLSTADLNEPSTWPALTRLCIECDLVPQWPIKLDPDYFGGRLPPAGTYIPPMTIKYVLTRIYDHFQQRIRHVDWAKLNIQDQIGISKAYTARCTALGSAEAFERSNGVKKIDYTRGNVWFKGLTRVRDGTEMLKLHLTKWRGRDAWRDAWRDWFFSPLPNSPWIRYWNGFLQT